MAVRSWMVVGSCMVIVKFGYRVKVCDCQPAGILVAFSVSAPSAWQLLEQPGAPMDC